MKKIIIYLHVFSLLFFCVFGHAASIDIVDNTVIADTDAYTIHFHDGTITYIHNKLTGVTYTLPLLTDSKAKSGLFWKDRSNIRVDGWGWSLFDLKKMDTLGVSMIYAHNKERLVIFIYIDAITGELVIEQEATVDKKGLAEISWGVSNIGIKNMKMIVPAYSGISIDESTPLTHGNFEYPSSNWEAQLAIFQGTSGGFFVRNTDTSLGYKRFAYAREQEIYRVTFVTQNYAPFMEHTTIKTAQWRLNTYSGDWRLPARQYRQWMDQVFSPIDLPQWVNGINFYVNASLDMEVLRQLKNNGISAENTLIMIAPFESPANHLPSGDYRIHSKAADYVSLAHSLGYKVMAYINARGVWPQEPRYAMMQEYQLRDPWSNEGKTFGKHIYVNHASTEFREFFVRQAKRLYEHCPIDAILLDASHLVTNDNNGEIDGLRAPQGTIQLQKDLLQALPEVVLAGERSHETTFAHEAFAIWGPGNNKLNPHPISSYLFAPYTYSCSGLPNPDVEDIYWRLEFHKVRGQLPSLRIWIAGIQLNVDHPNTRTFVSAVAEWQRSKPIINLDSDLFYDPMWTDLYITMSGYSIFDLNGDGQVNILDLVIVANAFGEPEPDLNGDGVVNILDLIIVANSI